MKQKTGFMAILKDSQLKTVLLLCIFSLIIYCPLYAQELTPQEVAVIGKETIDKIGGINNYQFLLVKREIVEDRDTGYQYMQVKVQSKPLRVYIKFLKPARYVDREVIYDGKELVVRRGGRGAVKNLVVHITPDAPIAMDGNRYPITHISPSSMCSELVVKISKELGYPNTSIVKKDDVAIYKQPGIHYKLTHAAELPGMECKTAEMVISKELGIPLYFKVVDWKDRIVEEYAFQSMKVNVNFTSDEFDENNPEYGFKYDED